VLEQSREPSLRIPNPAFAEVEVPLASTFMLSTKKGKEAYVEPVIEGRGYRFTVKVGTPENLAKANGGTTAGRRRAFQCLLSNVPMTYDYIRAESKTGRMGVRMMAIVAEGDRGRIYLTPTPEHETAAHQAIPEWKPEVDICHWPGRTNVVEYGLTSFGDLFTPRQLVALTTFSDLVGEAMERAYRDHMKARAPEQHQTGNPTRRGYPHFEDSLTRDGDDGVATFSSRWQTDEQARREPQTLVATNYDKPLRDGGTGARAYAEAVGVYLAIGISRLADAQNSLCQWGPNANQTQHLFRRQAVPMVWDYAESSVFSGAAGDLVTSLTSMCRVLDQFIIEPACSCTNIDAKNQQLSVGTVISTDPPYYDNIGYADLSDFFYVWLRRSLKLVFPDLFSTLAVPKAEELVATPYRHGGKEAAETFFLEGMTQAIRRLVEQVHPGFPVTIYYAFKQSETRRDSGTTSTGWETFLDAVIGSGFAITGTWPMRTERGARSISIGVNALASSIVLVCRRRPDDAPTATRREYLAALRSELPQALRLLQTGNVAPVDLAQAAVGPGMAVYTRYAKVLDATGNPLSVRDALALINRILDEVLAEQEGDFDADSRWAVSWFEQHGFDDGEYGVAETLSKAKNTSVAGLVEAGILASKGGTVRLLKPDQLPEDWDPNTDARLTAWEMVHHLIRVLEADGESAAAELAARLGTKSEVARELCYRLYTLCERKKRAGEALSYNSLVRSWPEITRLARDEPGHEAEQTSFFATEDGQSGS